MHEFVVLRKYAAPPMNNYLQAKYKNIINSTCYFNVAVTTISINTPKRKKKYDFFYQTQ